MPHNKNMLLDTDISLPTQRVRAIFCAVACLAVSSCGLSAGDETSPTNALVLKVLGTYAIESMDNCQNNYVEFSRDTVSFFVDNKHHITFPRTITELYETKSGYRISTQGEVSYADIDEWWVAVFDTKDERSTDKVLEFATYQVRSPVTSAKSLNNLILEQEALIQNDLVPCIEASSNLATLY